MLKYSKILHHLIIVLISRTNFQKNTSYIKSSLQIKPRITYKTSWRNRSTHRRVKGVKGLRSSPSCRILLRSRHWHANEIIKLQRSGGVSSVRYNYWRIDPSPRRHDGLYLPQLSLAFNQTKFTYCWRNTCVVSLWFRLTLSASPMQHPECPRQRLLRVRSCKRHYFANICCMR